MSPRSQRAHAPLNAGAELRTSVAPTITIIQETHEPFQNDLEIREKWKLSAELSRKVALEAGGRIVGRRIIVATEDLRAYLRAQGTPPANAAPAAKPAKPRLVVTKTKALTAADVARANGLTVKDPDK